jgi:hypothetical protein
MANKIYARPPPAPRPLQNFINLQSILCEGTAEFCGPGSSVGIAKGYELAGPGIESGGGEIFRTCSDQPWNPPSLLYKGYRVFPGGRKRPGRDADL